MKTHHTFPNDFVWGVATSSFQIEGATYKDGRGPSVWDDFCRLPGRVSENNDGVVACDHYNRFEQDVKLIKNLGVNSYRFSISWSRVLPKGEGEINSKGLDFYSRLVDALLKEDIKPFVTLFHWDLPSYLQTKYNGWLDKKIIRFYERYVKVVTNALGDRVSDWITHNEIMCFTRLSHQKGCYHAPGIELSLKQISQTVHNALVAHGAGVNAIRAYSKLNPKIGLVDNSNCFWPIYDSEEHVEAAKKAFYAYNQDILFPILTGEYDEKAYKKTLKELPDYTSEEMQLIGTPIDFIGYNIYQGSPIKSCDNEKGFEIVEPSKSYPRTFMGWTISPKSIYYGLMFSRHFFPNHDVYITENGMAADDVQQKNGEVHDLDRLEYYRSYLEMCSRAIKDGANLRGYFAWSLMDNFEWSFGYS